MVCEKCKKGQVVISLNLKKIKSPWWRLWSHYYVGPFVLICSECAAMFDVMLIPKPGAVSHRTDTACAAPGSL